MQNRKSPPRSRSLVFRALLSFAPVIIPSAARLRASDATKPKRQIIGSYARQELEGLFCLRVKICHRNHTRSPTIRVRFCASKYFWQGRERERRVKKFAWRAARSPLMRQRKRVPTSLMQILERRRRRRSHVAGGGGRSDSDSATAEVANNGGARSDGHRISLAPLDVSLSLFGARPTRQEHCPLPA